MFKKGLSIYTGLNDYPIEKNLEYLKLARDLGYEFLFSSAHINEATQAFDDLQLIIDTAYEYGLKLSLDISKPAMSKFKDFNHLYALRLDYGFTLEEIVEMSNTKSYKVELNASTLKEEDLEKLIMMGLNPKNVRASFNFYPKLYTGHDVEFVKNKIRLFKKYGISVLIFIPSHTGMRPPMYEGLPSIETHRTMNLNLVIEDLKALGVDEIAFGDAYASKEELELLKTHQTDYLILPFNKVYNLPNSMLEHLNGTFQIRRDYNDLMLRSTTSRTEVPIPAFNTVERVINSVTIDNDKFLRYRGEINIITSPLPKDDRTNVVGMVNLTQNIITALKRGQKFIFGVEVDD
ncbi:MAG: MupG family TIM beta-alpha barrel fold protein [Mollicutes bacterium]|nr:MupG family TIM beta-alpha barrel fold protein [Mollicutes bacterium]